MPDLIRAPSSDGSEIVMHQLGGTGPDLVICHATGFHGLAYRSLAAPLVDTFTVWAIDFRGHGRSPIPPSGDFSWARMADDLLAGLDGAGVALPTVAFGHSMGGAAVLIAERSRPGSFSSVYLYEPIVQPPEMSVDDVANPMSGAARRRRATFGSKAEALRRYASRPPLNVLRADALNDYVEDGFVENGDGTVRLRCEPETEALTFESDKSMTLDRFGDLSLAGTVGAGAAGAASMPSRIAPAVADSMGMTLLIYEHLGHFGPLQAPELIAADIEDVLVS